MRQSISKDLSRKVFTHRGNDCWECKDYKTFYMTIRPYNLETDKRKGRDPKHYTLFTNFGPIVHNLKSIIEAFNKGYELADKEYEARFPGLNYKY